MPTRLTAALALLVALSAAAPAQEPGRKRGVIINLKEGGFLMGAFISADENGVKIQTGQDISTVKLDAVRSIVFAEADYIRPLAPAPASQTRRRRRRAKHSHGRARPASPVGLDLGARGS